jgi:hypothetical protein
MCILNISAAVERMDRSKREAGTPGRNHCSNPEVNRMGGVEEVKSMQIQDTF